MSTPSSDELKDLLFSSPDRKLLNIQLTRGTGKVIDPDALRAEICSIIRQRESGMLQPSGPARSGRPQINVREMLERL
jgi:chromosome condensin MukBEF MukE localization factor